MTADSLKFSRNGMQDTGFEAPRRGIAAERAEQQCNCYWCYIDCHYECWGTSLGYESGVYLRDTYEEGEMVG